jgi:hypothetical protein
MTIDELIRQAVAAADVARAWWQTHRIWEARNAAQALQRAVQKQRPLDDELAREAQRHAFAWGRGEALRVEAAISNGWQGITIDVPGRRFSGPLCPARAKMRADDPTCPTAWKCKGEGCALPIWIGIDLAGPGSDFTGEMEVRP